MPKYNVVVSAVGRHWREFGIIAKSPSEAAEDALRLAEKLANVQVYDGWNEDTRIKPFNFKVVEIYTVKPGGKIQQFKKKGK